MLLLSSLMLLMLLLLFLLFLISSSHSIDPIDDLPNPLLESSSIPIPIHIPNNTPIPIPIPIHLPSSSSSSSSSTCFGAISSSEYEALFALFNATHGQYWRWNQSMPNTTQWSFPNVDYLSSNLSDLTAPCRDHWQGLYCESIPYNPNNNNNGSDVNCTIMKMELEHFNLHGELPTQIGQLSSLTTLLLFANGIHGTIPSEIALMHELNFLLLGGNLLTGTIPEEFSQFNTLFALDASLNFLSGQLSSDLFRIPTLSVVNLQYNLLNGTVRLSNVCHSLKGLYLAANLFSGTIASDLPELLPNIKYLWLNQNEFDGYLPLTIGNFSLVEELYLANNSFHGPIPTQIANLPKIVTLTLMFNMFSHTVPTEIGLMSSLRSIGLFGNQLTGRIPAELGQLTAISFLALFENLLTGTMPKELTNVSHCVGFAFNTNFLEHEMVLPNSKLLQFIYMYENYFTGTLPLVIFSRTTLSQILLQSNLFTGTIPEIINYFPNLTHFSVGSNSLSGSLPFSMRHLVHLELIDFSSNHFSGRLERAFSPLNTGRLNYIDVSRNSFSGSIPSEIFESDRLQTVSLFSNCFQGSIPLNICYSKVIDALILDGLSSAAACQVPLSPLMRKIIRVSIPKNLMTGSMPECVWQSTSLRVLHASGNGLFGTLGDLAPKSQLNDVNLAYNNLEGTIPSSLQSHGTFVQLGLSNNRLTGILTDSFSSGQIASRAQVELSVNRLSGGIPSGFYAIESVDMLSGNLFQCSDSNLPSSDPNRDDYVCGSSNFNDSIVTWAACVLIAGIFFISLRYIRSKNSGSAKDTPTIDKSLSRFSASVNFNMIKEELRLSIKTQTIELGQNCQLFMTFLSEAISLALLLSSLFLFVMMTSYVVIKVFSSGTATAYSTHQQQYAWISSAAFLHGAVPTGLLLGYYIISLFIVRAGMTIADRDLDLQWKLASRAKIVEDSKLETELDAKIAAYFSGDKVDDSSRRTEEQIANDQLQKAQLKETTTETTQKTVLMMNSMLTITFWIPTLYQLCNVLVTLLINFLYVFGIFSGIDKARLLLLQLCVSCVKLYWVRISLPQLTSAMPGVSAKARSMHSLLMNLVLYIAGPIVATYLADSSCLYYVFKGQENVQSSYNYFLPLRPICLTLDSTVACALLPIEQTATTSFSPPWLYSFECASSLLTSYVPVFLFSYCISGIVFPVVMVAYVSWRNYYPSIRHSKAGALVESIINQTIGNSILEPKSLEEMKLDSSRRKVRYLQDIKLFVGSRIENRTMLDLALMLTFGLAAPVLGATIALQIVISGLLRRHLILAYIGAMENKAKLLDNRISSMSDHESVINAVIATKPPSDNLDDSSLGTNTISDSSIRHTVFDSHSQEVIIRLEQSTRDATLGVARCLRVVVCASAVFWGLLCLDMIGDVHGNTAGIVVMCFVIFGTPLGYFIGEIIWRRHRNLLIPRNDIMIFDADLASSTDANARCRRLESAEAFRARVHVNSFRNRSSAGESIFDYLQRRSKTSISVGAPRSIDPENGDRNDIFSSGNETL